MGHTTDDTLDGRAGHNCALPTLSALTSLTQLELSMGLPGQLHAAELDVSCLCSLKALQYLQLSSASSMYISPYLSDLKRLTCLKLEVRQRVGANDDMKYLRLGIDWAAMQALQHLEISSMSILNYESLLTLSRMRHLKFVYFGHFSPQTSTNIQTSARVVYLLARDCSEVVVCLGETVDYAQNDISS